MKKIILPKFWKAKVICTDELEEISQFPYPVDGPLNIILPNDLKSAGQGKSQPAGSGRLDNGIFFEDYKNNLDGAMEIVRYYFQGDKLVKISSASYRKNNSEKIEGRRCIIKIQEFSSAPETSLLNLPAGVKDETKRR